MQRKTKNRGVYSPQVLSYLESGAGTDPFIRESASAPLPPTGLSPLVIDAPLVADVPSGKVLPDEDVINGIRFTSPSGITVSLGSCRVGALVSLLGAMEAKLC